MLFQNPQCITPRDRCVLTGVTRNGRRELMDAPLTNDYLARAREILGDRTDTEIEYDDTIVAFLTKGIDIQRAVDAANREHPNEALKPDPADWEDLAARYDYILKHKLILQKLGIKE
jgi:hypothetical protein